MDHVESVENSAGREAVEEFWEKAVESKCEGLMIKVRGTLSLIRSDKKNDLLKRCSFLITQKSVVISIQERTQLHRWRTLVRTPMNSPVQLRHGTKGTLTDHTRRAGRNPYRPLMNQVRSPLHTLPPLSVTYKTGLFREFKHSHRQADLRLAQTQERLRRRSRR